MRACVWASLIGALLVAACGDDGGGGGGGSLTSRCDAWCERHNADEACGADYNCPASCGSIVGTANNTGCTAEADALFTCFEDTADLCPAGGAQPCAAENTSLVQCENGFAADAGP